MTIMEESMRSFMNQPNQLLNQYMQGMALQQLNNQVQTIPYSPLLNTVKHQPEPNKALLLLEDDNAA